MKNLHGPATWAKNDSWLSTMTTSSDSPALLLWLYAPWIITYNHQTSNNANIKKQWRATVSYCVCFHIKHRIICTATFLKILFSCLFLPNTKQAGLEKAFWLTDWLPIVETHLFCLFLGERWDHPNSTNTTYIFLNWRSFASHWHQNAVQSMAVLQV